MEDYKKKYEEALERANAKIETYNHLDNASMVKSICDIFPELKESEDERIRKAITIYLKSIIEHKKFGDKFIESWIAWLENQGKKIDVIENFDTEFEKQVSHLIASTINKEYEYTSDFVKWTANTLLNYAKHELEKQGEQNNKHLYDVIIALWDLLDKIDTFSDLQIDDTNPDNPFKKIEYIAQERHKFVKSDGYNLYIQGEQITDFKQSKQKPDWSEEEKARINKIIDVLDWAEEKGYIHHSDWEDYVCYVKSLKPQNTWKPSDGQIKQLGWVAEQNKDNMIGKELMTLYNDLKKLREE